LCLFIFATSERDKHFGREKGKQEGERRENTALLGVNQIIMRCLFDSSKPRAAVG
jgi:hypothetical protein